MQKDIAALPGSKLKRAYRMLWLSAENCREFPGFFLPFVQLDESLAIGGRFVYINAKKLNIYVNTVDICRG